MKTTLRLIFSFFISINSYLMSMDPAIVNQIDQIREAHFDRMASSGSKEYDYFCHFSEDIIQMAESNPDYSETVKSEPMCQYVVQSLACRLSGKGYNVDDHTVANNLALYMPQYRVLHPAIINAFDPNGTIQSPWYANATKDIQVQYLNRQLKEYGHNGGIMTPLSLAVKKAHYDWCKKLIAAGADVNKKYPDLSAGTMTALYEAICLKDQKQDWIGANIYKKIIKLLLTKGALVDLGYENYKGHKSTPLWKAIHNHDKSSVVMLWIWGARPSANDFASEENLEWFKSLSLPQQ